LEKEAEKGAKERARGGAVACQDPDCCIPTSHLLQS